MKRLEDASWDGFPSLYCDAVMYHFRRHARRKAIWAAMPLDDVEGELRRVLRELLNVACDLNDRTRLRRLKKVAALHGTFRRRQGISEDAISGDVVLMFRALQSALRHSDIPVGIARRSLEILEAQLRVAERASRASFRG